MERNELTIVVPTKNEHRNILPFLRSIPEDIALIVVDASEDETRELIRETRPKNTTVIYDPGNIPCARQKGTELANTEWILYTDVDVVFADEYFQQLAFIELTPRYAGIVGAKRSQAQYQRYYRLFSLGLRLLCFLKIPGASGSNMIVRRDAVYKAGGFDLKLSCNEDSMLMWKVRRCGYRVKYCGKLSVYETDHRRLEKGMLRKTFHSVFRCLALFSGILPHKLRHNDWGYWKS